MSETDPSQIERLDGPCMHSLFEAQAARTPDAVAVVFGDERLTYAALNARANQLAHHLRARMVGPETPVGVCLDRSATMIVALLAVLKAGGAYVPLDPGYPAERLAFMLEDSEVPLLISEHRVLRMLPALAADIICLDDCPELAAAPTVNPASGVSAANLAYVIYTSGSTGRPKGVEVTHQTVVHLFTATRQLLGLREGDVWTVVHSSGFDFSVWEIWGSLLQGGTLVVVPLNIVHSPPELFNLLRREGVTVLNQTPSALRALLDARRQVATPQGRDWSVRLIVCGGDALDHDLASDLARLEMPVWNFYGPTESSVWTTCTLIKDAGADHAPSIGQAIAGLEVYLVDDDQQLVPPGASGELLIGGAGLARGYRQRPELTAERFIPHCFSKEPGARLYRTGDSARYLADGGIEFLGRIDHQVSSRTAADAITRTADRTGAPLSFAQERMWFLSQLVRDMPVYHLPMAVPIDLRPDVDALKRALNEIVRRHVVLRTTVATAHGSPAQVAGDRLTLHLPLVDLTGFPLDDRRIEADRITADEAGAPFDLVNGPLVRSRLLRWSENEHVLLITMHHIVSDGWSMVVLLRELGALYEAFAAGKPSPLPELALQYADYAMQQRASVGTEVLENDLRYWKEQLEGAPLILNLPADRPRPSVQTFRGAREVLEMSPRLTETVKTFSQREGVTPFMALIAVFSVLLHRYTGEQDILIGSPIVSRRRRHAMRAFPSTDVEGLIGLFLNNVVVRARFPQEVQFRTLLRQVRDAAMGASAHQDLPFEMLVESLNPPRDSSRTPLFQVFFNFQSFTVDKIGLPGLARNPVSPAAVWSPDPDWSQFDLTFYVAEIDNHYQLIVVYSADLFNHDRIAALLRQFRFLLEQAVSAPDELVTAYTLCDGESAAVLPNPGLTLPQPDHEAVPQTFFSVAGKMPERLAICQGSESWSYRDLSEQAERIARRLLADGLVKGEAVAISGPPSMGVIAGMLGVLAAGGVLLLLDRNLPIERRKLMIREAAARRLLHVGDWSAADDSIRQDPSLAVREIVEFDGTLIGADQAGAANAVDLPEPAPDDAAYLFFTSGTTGVPKAVLGRHKGLSHFLDWQRETFGIGPDDRSAQLTGLSFDVVLRDIFLPLTSGASVHLPDDLGDLSSGRTLAWLARQRITVLHTVPSIAQHWLNDLPSRVDLSTLRWVFFAGEPLTDTLVRRWRDAFPGSGQVVNLYGPTETTLAKCYYVVPEDPGSGVQPVGWPLPETQALVLNRHGGLCGIGEPGEIAIRTPFRTLGYINAADENSRRFVRNRLTDDPNDLIYSTGDRGRYRPGGALEILGRLDDQTKVRGVRVEPGEVSAVLAKHPAVAACVVTSVKDLEGDNALAAYVVPTRQAAITVPELRVYLETMLPAAMVPSYFVVLDDLPLTPNGKVDRPRLPDPRESDRAVTAAYVAPRNPTEGVIAQIWSEVLGIASPGVFDSFFELGGHSLKATRVISRINAAFQTEVPLRTIFETVTVAGLAAVVEDRLIEELELTPGDELDERRP